MRKERIDDHIVRGVPYQAHRWGQKVGQRLLEQCMLQHCVLVLEAQLTVFVPFRTRFISCTLELFLFFPRAKCKVSRELPIRFPRFDSSLCFPLRCCPFSSIFGGYAQIGRWDRSSCVRPVGSHGRANGWRLGTHRQVHSLLHRSNPRSHSYDGCSYAASDSACGAVVLARLHERVFSLSIEKKLPTGILGCRVSPFQRISSKGMKIDGKGVKGIG